MAVVNGIPVTCAMCARPTVACWAANPPELREPYCPTCFAPIRVSQGGINAPFSVYLGRPRILQGSWTDHPAQDFNEIAGFIEASLGLAGSSHSFDVTLDFPTLDALIVKLADLVPDQSAIPHWNYKIGYVSKQIEQLRNNGAERNVSEFAAKVEFWRERIEQASQVGSSRIAGIHFQRIEHLKLCLTARKRGEPLPPPPQGVIEVNWELLQANGSTDWRQVLHELRASSESVGGALDETRLRLLHAEKPDLIYVGRSGFSGYVVFVFVRSDTALLESGFTGNALYAMKASDWRELSKLSKSELLSNHRSDATRVIHGRHWQVTLHRLLRNRGIR